MRVKLGGKKGGMRDKYFKNWFYFSLPYTDLTGSKFN